MALGIRAGGPSHFRKKRGDGVSSFGWPAGIWRMVRWCWELGGGATQPHPIMSELPAGSACRRPSDGKGVAGPHRASRYGHGHIRLGSRIHWGCRSACHHELGGDDPLRSLMSWGRSDWRALPGRRAQGESCDRGRSHALRRESVGPGGPESSQGGSAGSLWLRLWRLGERRRQSIMWMD